MFAHQRLSPARDHSVQDQQPTHRQQPHGASLRLRLRWRTVTGLLAFKPCSAKARRRQPRQGPTAWAAPGLGVQRRLQSPSQPPAHGARHKLLHEYPQRASPLFNFWTHASNRCIVNASDGVCAILFDMLAMASDLEPSRTYVCATHC